MKVKEIVTQNPDDYRSRLSIEIDGKSVFLVRDGEPEDSNLSRDFSDCYSIVDLMERAYEAGKNGEEFEVERVGGEDD